MVLGQTMTKIYARRYWLGTHPDPYVVVLRDPPLGCASNR